MRPKQAAKCCEWYFELFLSQQLRAVSSHSQRVARMAALRQNHIFLIVADGPNQAFKLAPINNHCSAAKPLLFRDLLRQSVKLTGRIAARFTDRLKTSGRA